jgi:uncharacterized membrane protein
MKFLHFINKLSNGIRLIIAACLGATVAILLSNMSQPSIHWMSAWLTFSFTHLFFSWTTILSCNVSDIKKIAKAQDSGRTVLSLFVLLATGISLIAILLLYVSGGEKSGSALFTHVLMTLLSVGTAWAMVHTTFMFKYAHLYYTDGGLDFPGESNPNYMDFVYFSFVIGTTFQVSDVSISSSRIRRTAFIHGVLSFSFNTIILALSINIIASLLQNQ